MKNNKIQSILTGIAEEAAPSAEIKLWKKISRRLATSESRYNEKRKKNMKPNFARNPVVRWVTLTALAVILAFGVLLITPQGRAWAQELISTYFTRAESDTLPPLTSIPENPTEDPGFTFNQAILDIEQQAGFDVLEPSWLPGILSFDGASYDPEQNITRIFCQYNMEGPDNTNGLVVRQEPFETADNCELCGVVGDSAEIETVQIGNFTGEYVVGVWKLTDSGRIWESDPYLQTLRWQANGMAFEFIYMGNPDDVTKADLIAIAESMK
jgi:hypothetical protein